MIYFAGAGCGAADLITVRGMKLLENAVETLPEDKQGHQ